jgi:heme-binding NEAT domain protein
MSKEDRQKERLKNVSGGGQTPGTTWGTTPGEATHSAGKKVTTPHTERGNEVPEVDGEDRTRIEGDADE